MKKQISFSGKGRMVNMGSVTIYRILPNRYADAVGSFVFLDHLPPKEQTSFDKSNSGAHPHRGIATLTYILDGEDEHFDSAGNYAKVNSGGVQWMKAGNGIVHDESLGADTQSDNKLTHGFQFWINLPSKTKEEKPAYLAVQATEVPQLQLENESGWLKVIVGEFGNLKAKIPNYMYQFLYHIHLEADKTFSIKIENETEVAAFLPNHDALINSSNFSAGEFIEFDIMEGEIELKNTSKTAIDVLLFGGEPYKEPIVAEGPFIMNNKEGIVDAYNDYHSGKYGTIQYPK